MASVLHCKGCGLRMHFRDTEPMRLRCPRCAAGAAADAPGDRAPPRRPPPSDAHRRREKARARAQWLVRLAIDPGAPDGERTAAARAACGILTRYGLLDRRFDDEDVWEILEALANQGG